jgi:hypothetical protein
VEDVIIVLKWAQTIKDRLYDGVSVFLRKKKGGKRRPFLFIVHGRRLPANRTHWL